VSYRSDLEVEPWRFDFYAALRRTERSFPDKPRIGDSASRRDEYLALGQDPYMDFPASTISKADRDAAGRLRLFVKFLGLLGPQGALPLTTTEEAYLWWLARDDAFPRFLDLFNHRFLQLFFRAWAEARPIAQHDRPEADRFETYIGAAVGIGSPPYRDLDTVPDAGKLAFGGLIAPQAKSASRLKRFISGLFGVEVEVEEFVGSHLPLDPSERTMLGQKGSALGVDTLIGGSVFSVQDKIRIRIHVKDLREYESFLPSGKQCQRLADAVFFFIGDQLDWDVELALPAWAAEPAKLGSSGRLGWTGWMSPNWTRTDQTERCDARFHPASRRTKSKVAA
jgi:type VI secretion system protein ImpH